MNTHANAPVRRAFFASVAAAICLAADADTQLSADTTFMAENRAAMNRMMTDMSVQPSGDVDQDFAALMIPHHQGAIEMAQSELRYGRNEQLRRIAQEIIVEQQQEIVAMRSAAGAAKSGTSSMNDRQGIQE